MITEKPRVGDIATIQVEDGIQHITKVLILDDTFGNELGTNNYYGVEIMDNAFSPLVMRSEMGYLRLDTDIEFTQQQILSVDSRSTQEICEFITRENLGLIDRMQKMRRQLMDNQIKVKTPSEKTGYGMVFERYDGIFGDFLNNKFVLIDKNEDHLVTVHLRNDTVSSWSRIYEIPEGEIPLEPIGEISELETCYLRQKYRGEVKYTKNYPEYRNAYEEKGKTPKIKKN